MMVVNEAPYNYMLPAILSCLFCFLPLGLIAIVAAYKVSICMCVCVHVRVRVRVRVCACVRACVVRGKGL